MQPLGRPRWVIAEGYLPGRTQSGSRELASHETACILNASDQPARVRDNRSGAIALMTTTAWAEPEPSP